MTWFMLFAILMGCAESQQGPLPIVLWHGMGDSCCNPLSLGSFKDTLQKLMPGTQTQFITHNPHLIIHIILIGVYVHSLQIGNNFAEDTENGFFMDSNEQVEMACSKIAKDAKLRNG